MKLLLDTHIFVWAALDHPRLPAAAAEMILDPDNEVAISVASTWEMSSKAASGRWPEAVSLLSGIEEAADDLGASVIRIDLPESILAGQLLWAHRDPFDRMLAAQTSVGGRHLVTVDPAFADAEIALAL